MARQLRELVRSEGVGQLQQDVLDGFPVLSSYRDMNSAYKNQLYQQLTLFSRLKFGALIRDQAGDSRHFIARLKPRNKPT